MIARQITGRILRDLDWFPIVGIVGARQVGKTTLVQHIQTLINRPSIYLDLELSEDWQKLQDAQSYLSQYVNECVVIDEVQIKPELFSLLRALVDQQRTKGRFLLLGSASPHVVKRNTQTLAGRISYHELAPFSFSEIKELYTVQQHWLKGGFPEPLLAPSPILARTWMTNFVETFIYRDLARLGFTVSVPVISQLLSMLAHLHGDLLNYSSLSRSLGVTGPTVKRYIELLEGSFLLRRLPPFFENVKKRLTKSNKVYLVDTGLLHHLHNIHRIDNLQGAPIVGASWEGYVIEQIIREAPEFSKFYFYRTQSGAEIDLLMIAPNGARIAIEIKYSISPKLTKGYYEAVKDISPARQYVITPGNGQYDQQSISVVGIEYFLETEMIKIASEYS